METTLNKPGSRKHKSAAELDFDELNKITIESKINWVRGWSTERKLALHMHRYAGDAYNHFDAWLWSAPQNENKQSHFLEYLKILEVPQVDIYDLQASPSGRIIDLATEGAVQLKTSNVSYSHDPFMRLYEYVLSKTPDINKSVGATFTPLLLASKHGLQDVVSMLIRYGANPEILDPVAGTNCDEYVEFMNADNDRLQTFRREYFAMRNASKLNASSNSQKIRLGL